MKKVTLLRYKIEETGEASEPYLVMLYSPKGRVVHEADDVGVAMTEAMQKLLKENGVVLNGTMPQVSIKSASLKLRVGWVLVYTACVASSESEEVHQFSGAVLLLALKRALRSMQVDLELPCVH